MSTKSTDPTIHEAMAAYKPKNGLTMIDHIDLAKRAMSKAFPKIKIGEQTEYEGKTLRRYSKMYYMWGSAAMRKGQIIQPRANALGRMRYKADNPDAPIFRNDVLDRLEKEFDEKVYPDLIARVAKETEAMRSLE